MTETGNKEWLELTENERSELVSHGAFIKGFLIVAILYALITSVAKASGYILTIGILPMIVVEIFLTILFKSINADELKDAVSESLKRTENEEYLALLREKGITLHPLTESEEKTCILRYDLIKKPVEQTEITENSQENNKTSD